ncbi:MAG TPA: radical SAM protein [Geobacteraceae bacterium]|nr:radical SAM protein [Geobacteraceae bacterium]
MTRRRFSLILLPTLACDADCDYCFEAKSKGRMTLDRFSTICAKTVDYLVRENICNLSIYWQGGEVLTMPPEWFDAANGIIAREMAGRGVEVANYLQSNLISYGPRWRGVIADMFNDSVGTSMDLPNRHRRLPGGTPEEYERLWLRNVRDAREAGIEVGFIAIPNRGTLEMGAKPFYSRIVDEWGIREFQINTPFPGGPPGRVKEGYPLDPEWMADFLVELATVRRDRGGNGTVRIGPLDRLMDYFADGSKDLVCIWQHNCAHEFVCIDPLGQVSQCDCWAASYPEFHFGNIFEADTLAELLRASPARRRILDRPGVLIQRGECLDCNYLGICHGGCPVRAYTVYGDINARDPYCRMYQRLFAGLENLMASGDHPGRPE